MTLVVKPDVPLNAEFSLYSCSDLTYQFGDPVQEGKGSKTGPGKIKFPSGGGKKKKP